MYVMLSHTSFQCLGAGRCGVGPGFAACTSRISQAYNRLATPISDRFVLREFGGSSCLSGTWVCRRPPPVEAGVPSLTCRSASIEPIPQDIQIEVKPEDGTTNVDYDEASKVVRIPLSALGPEGRRRSKLVLFTCNKCGARTARMVNPIAWENGVVFGQCSKCEVWHVLASNNKKIFEEVRYKDDPQYRDMIPLEESSTVEGIEGQQPGSG